MSLGFVGPLPRGAPAESRRQAGRPAPQWSDVMARWLRDGTPSTTRAHVYEEGAE